METNDQTSTSAIPADLAELRERLCADARLFDEPTAYTAGVLDTIDALTGTHLGGTS